MIPSENLCASVIHLPGRTAWLLKWVVLTLITRRGYNGKTGSWRKLREDVIHIIRLLDSGCQGENLSRKIRRLLSLPDGSVNYG